MATEWALDFCLVCDRQTVGEAYCSQACRLVELDQIFSESAPSSPTSVEISQALLSDGMGSSSTHPTLGLSPTCSAPSAVTSSAHRSRTTSSQSRSPGLTISSSRTSLSSLQSVNSQSPSLSDNVLHELRDYTSCFDQVRDWKRRLTA